MRKNWYYGREEGAASVTENDNWGNDPLQREVLKRFQDAQQTLLVPPSKHWVVEYVPPQRIRVF
jgi:hypothetical protein